MNSCSWGLNYMLSALSIYPTPALGDDGRILRLLIMKLSLTACAYDSTKRSTSSALGHV
jgi:hypothetical protein